jgi:cytochrome c
MKLFRLVLVSLFVLSLGLTFAFAAGDVENGKKLFNDPKFAGGTAGKSCNSCHPDGKGLEKSGTKKKFGGMFAKAKNLQEVVNMCIMNPMKGKPIDPKSKEMADIVAYIKSLAPKK